MIDKKYNRKNKTNKKGINSLSKISLSEFSNCTQTVNDSAFFSKFKKADICQKK